MMDAESLKTALLGAGYEAEYVVGFAHLVCPACGGEGVQF